MSPLVEGVSRALQEAAQGAFLISIVLMLYSTVSTMIEVLGLGITDHPLVEQPDEDEEVEGEEIEKEREELQRRRSD